MQITVILKNIEYYGVGVILYKSIAQNVTNFVPVNERIMLV